MEWTLRIASRPWTNGRSRITLLSKRPGRNRGGSRMSGRLVAAMTILLVPVSKPSILDEDLVQGLLSFVVTAAQACAAMATNGVYFVHEHDAGGVPLGLVKEVAHTSGANADEHLDELAAADGEEGDGGFAGDGAGKESLAGARGANEEDAAGNAGAEGEEPVGVLEKLDYFLKLGLGLICAGNVGEADGGPAGEDHLGLAAAKVHGLVAAALGLAHEEDDQRAKEDEGQESSAGDRG